MMALPLPPQPPDCRESARKVEAFKRRQERFHKAMQADQANQADGAPPLETIIVESSLAPEKGDTAPNDSKTEMMWVVLVSVIAVVFSWLGIR